MDAERDHLPAGQHELDLWCLYEQPHGSRISSHLLRLNEVTLHPDTPDLQRALELLGLHWASTS